MYKYPIHFVFPCFIFDFVVSLFCMCVSFLSCIHRYTRSLTDTYIYTLTGRIGQTSFVTSLLTPVVGDSGVRIDDDGVIIFSDSGSDGSETTSPVDDVLSPLALSTHSSCVEPDGLQVTDDVGPLQA